MKNLKVSLFLLTLLVLCSCAKKVDIEAEKEIVINVIEQLNVILETEDMEMLSNIYSQDADIVIFGTDSSERIVGFEALKEVIKEQFEHTDSSQITIGSQVVKVHSSGEVAWFSELLDWEVVSMGEYLQLTGLRVTGVLEKQNGKWVVVQLHYSAPAGS